jgi:hypothetical protein
MNDEKQNELDNLFREEIENLPEEQPSARDWEQMSKRIQAEGLLEKSNGRKYLFLILLALLATIVSLPFLMDNKQGVKSEEAKSSEVAKNLSAGNKISEPTKTKAAPTETTPTKTTINSENSSTSNPSLHLKNEMTPSRAALSANNGNRKVKENSLSDNKNLQTNSKAEEKTAETKNNKMSEAKTDGGNNKSLTPETTAEENHVAAPPNANVSDEKNNPVTSASDSVNTVEKSSVDSTSTAKDTTQPHDSSAPGRFRLSIYASLDYNYYALKENKNVTQAEANYVNQSDLIKGDKWGGQYTIGIIGGYLFTQKLSLEAGAFYSQKKKLHASINTPAYNSEGEEMFSDFTYDYKARYFELYGRMKYYLRQRKNSWYATIGAAGSFNLPESISTSDYFSRVSYGESSTKTEDVKLNASSVGAILIISGGVEIPLGKRCDIYIEPAYKYSFSPVIKHSGFDQVPVEHLLRCISLATGLMYKF